MTCPRFNAVGASSTISRPIFSAILSQGLSCSPIDFRAACSVLQHINLIGFIMLSAWRSCTISRGLTREAATLEMRRSRSPIWLKDSCRSSRSAGSRKKYSTMSRRLLISLLSFRGKRSHLRRRRAPIGLMVRSITSRRLLPSSFMACTSSRLRMVNLSSLTAISSSMRESDVMWEIWVCCVMSR